jgi:hypothetical protein
LREYEAGSDSADKRNESRDATSPDCSAVVRISGIPIHQFELKDISRNGTCFLVAEESSILRHLHVGTEIEIQFHLAASGQPSEFHRSEIMHITRAKKVQYQGYCFVGVRIVSRLKVR